MISGIVGNPIGTTVIALDAIEGIIHSISVRNRVLEYVGMMKLGSGGGWRRNPYPFIEFEDYYQTNGFDCAVTVDGSIAAVTAPFIPITLLSLPDLRILGQFGGPGEARGLCWTGDRDKLLVNRLVADSQPKFSVRPEAFVLDTISGIRTAASHKMVGRTLCTANPPALLTVSDLEGSTEIYAHEQSAPFRPYDIKAICYVRPDGVALDFTQDYLSIVEMDFTHRLSVINIRSWSQRMMLSYAGETTRPDHAHNLSLIAIDHLTATVYSPGPAGCIHRHGIVDASSSVFASSQAEITGLFFVSREDLLLSADDDGTLKLWDPKHNSISNHPAFVVPVAPTACWNIQSGLEPTKIVEFDG